MGRRSPTPSSAVLAVRRAPTATPRSSPRSPARRAPSPRRRLRAGAGHVPPLRRGQGPPGRRARAPHQRRHPRGRHRRPGRDGRLRAVGARGVRRLRLRRRERLHGHGRRHRGAVAGLARRRRLAHHPARDPHPRAREGRHRGAEARVAAEARVGRDRWSRSPSPSPTSAPTWPASRSPRRRDDDGYVDQRRQDVVHVRRPRRRAHAAGPHRPRPLEDPPRASACSSCPSRGRGPRLRVHPGRRRASMEGRAIDTIGYRGMHSYEVAFEDWFVPAANLIGGEAGLGKGFYLQMEGFENGRLQTAARAVGVMQAAYEAARDYAARPRRLRPAHRRLPADAGEAGAHGGAHPGRRASSCTRSPGSWPRARARSRRRW